MSVFVSVIAFSNFGFFKGITKGITDVINIKVEQANIKEEDQAKRKVRLVKIARKQANINEEEYAKDQAFIKAHLAEFAKEQGVELSDIREGDVRLLKSGRFEKVLQWTEEGKKHYTTLREEKLIPPKKEKLLQIASNLDGEYFKDYGNEDRTPLVLRFLKSANRSLEVIKTLQSNDDEKIFEEVSNRHHNKEMVSSKTTLLEVCRELIQCATNNYFEIDNKVKVLWFDFVESSREIKFNIAGIKEAIGKAVQMRGTYADLLNLEHVLEREVDKLKNATRRTNNDFNERYVRFQEIDREINDIFRYIADIRERKNAAEKAAEEMLLISESKKFPLRSIQSKPIIFMKDIQSGVSKNWLKKYLIANEIRYEGGEKDDSSIIASYPQRKVYFCFYRNALISVEIVLSSTLGIFGGYSSDVSVDAFIKKYTTMLGPEATVTKRLGEVELGDSVGDTVSYCRIAKVWVETEIMSAFTQYSVSSMVTLPDNLAERMNNPFVDNFKK